MATSLSETYVITQRVAHSHRMHSSTMHIATSIHNKEQSVLLQVSSNSMHAMYTSHQPEGHEFS